MTDYLPPLPVALPLLIAALLMGGAPVFSRRVADGVATFIAAVVTSLCFLLMLRSSSAPIVYWFGGWKPHHGIALGIGFVIDPLGAGLAALVGALVTAAFVFSWRYFDEVGTVYHALMLVFLAAMCGFCLSGDLFNLFVFFELMSVAAYALTGYKIEEAKPLEGALNFNSLGGFLLLIGTALLYGRTGALNLAQIGQALAGHPADGLVAAAFVFITAAVFVKAAVVPFHFWLADAHAVAPTPVCSLFSGVMVTLGLYGAARVFWTVFSGPLAVHEADIKAILLGLGVLTTCWGGLMCWSQRHLKRLLAFSTVSHMGMVLCGIALLDARALAGASLYAMAHGLVKASLFFCAGILLNRFGSADEIDLRGKARDMHWSGPLFFLGALGLSGVPPFMTSVGKSIIEEAGRSAGCDWLPGVFLIGSALTGGAALRAGGRIYFGWGPTAGVEGAGPSGREKKEVKAVYNEAPWMMILPIALLLILALAAGLMPRLGSQALAAAGGFIDRPAYNAAVLTGARVPFPRLGTAQIDLTGQVYACASALIAVFLALLSLFRHRLPKRLVGCWERISAPAFDCLRCLQSGDVRDYIAWQIVGIAVLGALTTWAIRR
jgi:multicomponent Na+:H+ antiporter subunit D